MRDLPPAQYSISQVTQERSTSEGVFGDEVVDSCEIIGSHSHARSLLCLFTVAPPLTPSSLVTGLRSKERRLNGSPDSWRCGWSQDRLRPSKLGESLLVLLHLLIDASKP